MPGASGQGGGCLLSQGGASSPPLPEGEGTAAVPPSPTGKGARGLGPSSFLIFAPLDAPDHGPGSATARLRVERTGDGDSSRLLLEVEGYHSPELAARLGGDPPWREALDCVLIDPAYDGRIFRARLADAPPGRRSGICGRYEIPLPTSGQAVAIKLVDVLGEEALEVLSA